MSTRPRSRAKLRAETVQPKWGDEQATSRRYGLTVSILRKDRARPNPVLAFTKIPGMGRGGGSVLYDWDAIDRLMEDGSAEGQKREEESAAA